LKAAIGVLAGIAVLALAGCGGDDEVDLQAFCDQTLKAQASSAEVNAAQENDDFDAFKAATAQSNEQLQAVADEAPDEISDDFAAVAGYTADLNDQLQAAESFADLAGLPEELQSGGAAVAEPADNVQAYISENCDESG
jgi:Tfp pilus assembly protein PilP